MKIVKGLCIQFEVPVVEIATKIIVLAGQLQFDLLTAAGGKGVVPVIVVGDQSQAHRFGNHRMFARSLLVEQMDCRGYSEAPFANSRRRATKVPSSEVDDDTGAPQHHDFETSFNPHLANPMSIGVSNQIVSYRK